MDLNHEFTVPVPVGDAWRILTDVERIAPCLPGAKLEESNGDTYSGFVKVKVGPIQAQFKGQASFLERDDVAYKAVLKGEGRDTTGKGNASALITAQLLEESPTSTKVTVTTDLNITGKVAQFGRGAMADISNKLLDQFVENLNGLIAAGDTNDSATGDVGSSTGAASSPVVEKEVEALDLLSVSGGAILKRALPVVVVVAAVIIWLIAK
jgi:carbon monoxide dehydrogenase subunit G